MTLILCLDDKNGMAFNGRRQSTDKVLRTRILQQAQGKNLWMSPYSARRFEPLPLGVLVDADFMNKAASDDACFVETQDPSYDLHRFYKLIVYRWNRAYPADVYFPFEKHVDRLRLISSFNMEGNSHQRITEEVYEIM